MTFRQTSAVLLAAATLLLACAPSEKPATEAASVERDAAERNNPALALAPGETRYVLDAANSRLIFYTFRGGKLAKFGHNHIVLARGVTADIALTPAISGSRFRLAVPLAQLEVDNPELRAAAGDDFSSKPSAEDVAATKTNMLGERGLDAAKFPVVNVSGAVAGNAARDVTLAIELDIHGIRQRQTVPATITLDAGKLHIAGTLKLNQTSYGITPFSVMLGALTVLDEVTVDFDLIARPAT